VRHILELINRNVGRTPLEYVALAVHRYYTSNVRSPNNTIRMSLLPPWRSRDVFICLSTHNLVPEIKLYKDINTACTIQSMFERVLAKIPDGSDAETIALQSVRAWEKITALKWRMYGLNMGRMAYHEPERNIKLDGVGASHFNGLRLDRPGAKKRSAIVKTEQN
jgi:hypothetical protein